MNSVKLIVRVPSRDGDIQMYSPVVPRVGETMRLQTNILNANAVGFSEYQVADVTYTFIGPSPDFFNVKILLSHL